MNQFKLSNQYKAVVIGGSAGSFQVINKILAALPKDFELPIILCLHRLKHVRHGFVEALNIKSTKIITEPEDKEAIKKGHIYLAPANYHLLLELGNHFALSTDEMVNNSRPAIDLTMETAAYVYKNKLVGVLLSGANKDGALGMKKIKDRGGLTVIQDPKECMIDTMPVAAQKLTQIDYTLSVEHLCAFFQELDKYYR
jgi:two-component system, chemotaxis family, protein-glutamate methylesterase/glutaminase